MMEKLVKWITIILIIVSCTLDASSTSFLLSVGHVGNIIFMETNPLYYSLGNIGFGIYMIVLPVLLVIGVLLIRPIVDRLQYLSFDPVKETTLSKITMFFYSLFIINVIYTFYISINNISIIFTYIF